MLVEAAWTAAKAPGPLHAFFVRIRARRGHQIAAVAVARKLTVLCWHLLTKGEDYQWTRPALVANKTRAMQLQAGHPQQKGSRRGLARIRQDLDHKAFELDEFFLGHFFVQRLAHGAGQGPSYDALASPARSARSA
jgi:hypothetical protein